MSSWSGTPSRFTPSSSAVRPQRSSDSVKTIFAFLKLPSSCASCCTVSTMTRLISSASVAGTVENAAVRLTSAMIPLPLAKVIVAGTSATGSAASGHEVLRNVDHFRVLEVEVPPGRVHPRLGGSNFDRRPIFAGELLHLGLVRGLRDRWPEEDQNLFVALPDRHLTDEAERRHIDGIGGVLIAV